ncbi:MAG: Ig-like domain-containing protein, partial [Thalassotalea sp.]
MFKCAVQVVLLPLILILNACGGASNQQSAETSSGLKNGNGDITTADINHATRVNASSLQKVSFNYQASQNSGGGFNQTERASAVIDLPDQSKTAAGNLLLALDVIEPEGIEQVFLDFSNNNPEVPALQICGDGGSACLGSALLYGEETDSQYRLFINGINPHDYGWVSGENTINVWIDTKLGNRTLAATFTINWQAVTVNNSQASFVNVVTDPTTNVSTGDLVLTWSPVADYQFYNVFIASQPNVSSNTFTYLADGQARLSLTTNRIVFTNIDVNKPYYYAVSAVNDSGESAFSLEKVISIAGDDIPVANNDAAALNEAGNVIIDLLANDTSLQGTLAIASFSQGMNGTVFDNGDGSVTYTHDGSETLTDAFTYTISNGAFNSSSATVNINITAINDAPMAADDSAAVIEGSNVIIDLRS